MTPVAGWTLVPATDGGAVKDASGAAVLSRLEPISLQELASATGGAYRDAAAWVDLPALVAATVAHSEAGAFVESRAARVPDRFQWFLAPGVLFGLLSMWLEFPIVLATRRVPLARPASAIAALLLAFGLWASPRPASAVGATQPERQGRPVPPHGSALPPLANDPTEANALETAVASIAAKEAVSAADYAALASATFGYAATAPRDGAGSRTAVATAGAWVLLLRRRHRGTPRGSWHAVAAAFPGLGVFAAGVVALWAYGPLAHPAAAIIATRSDLRSVPTAAAQVQKPIEAGGVLTIGKRFLDWVQITRADGEIARLRDTDVVPIYGARRSGDSEAASPSAAAVSVRDRVGG